jgi:hypothetical protein
MAADDVLDLGEHLRDGLWRVDTASLPDLRDVPGVTIAGEAAALAGARLALTAVPEPGKPVSVDAPQAEGALLVCLAYDGEDASAVRALGAATGPVVVATTGGTLAAQAREAGHRVVPIPAGFTPESAIGYWVSITCDLLQRAAVAAGLREQVEAAADAVERLVARFAGGPERTAEALQAARALILEQVAAGQDGSIPRETALQRGLSLVLLVDVVIYHLGSLAVAGP